MKKLLNLLKKGLKVILIAFAAMIVFILGLWAIVWIGDITGLIVFDESSSCADDGKVWDEDRQECRDDCWTWTERVGCVPLSEGWRRK